MNQLQQIDVAGHRIAVRPLNAEESSGPPIFLIHGITASLYFWIHDLFAPFAPYGPCYALSLPGHYPAAFPEGFKREELTAERLAHVLDEAIRRVVGERPVVLAGHSTGGFAALDIAAHFPERAHRVVSISGFAHGRWTGLLGFNQRLARTGVGGLLFRLLYELNRVTRRGQLASWRVYVASARRLFAYPHIDEVFNDCYPAFKRLDLRAMTHYFATMPDIDIAPLLERIQAPTLVVVGKKDPIVPPAQASLIAERVPHATLVEVEGVGHLPFFEAPADYRRAVEPWLAAHLGRQA
ncbi:MAG: alpha/beta fold hydrolase [Anaerolineales bacterium]